MDVLVTLHDLWRWVVLAAFAVAVVGGVRKWRQGAEWRVDDRRWPLVATVTLDIQVLLGILIWAGQARWSGDHPFFTTWLHPIIMLAALAVAHATLSRSRRLRGPDRHRAVAVGLLAALIIVILGVPRYAWPT